MYLQKGISTKILKKLFFVGILKVTDEKSRIRSRTGIRIVSQRYGSLLSAKGVPVPIKTEIPI